MTLTSLPDDHNKQKVQVTYHTSASATKIPLAVHKRVVELSVQYIQSRPANLGTLRPPEPHHAAITRQPPALPQPTALA